jgi:hypothetical protein
MEIEFDFGNARAKWFKPIDSTYGDFEHAIAVLSDNEWANIVGRGLPPKGLIRLDGIPYAVGEAARRHIIQDRPKGAARYRDTYYTVALAHALSEAIRRSERVALYASHAPRDITYAAHLVQCVKRVIAVECHYGMLEFDVRKVSTFDEPLGGFANYVFNKDGTDRRKNPLADKTTLVVDVGGYTADVVAVDPGGEIDLMSLKSTLTGALKVIDEFTSDLRSNNREEFQDAGDLDIRRIEAAIISGHYQFGKLSIPCKKEANAAIMMLVNDVIQVINSAGGAANFDVILLTGGGSALIYDSLCAAMPRIDFLLSEPNRELMKYANVFGGAKIAALLRREKVR